MTSIWTSRQKATSAADTEQQRSEAEEFQRALAEALNTRRTPAAAAYGNAAGCRRRQGLARCLWQTAPRQLKHPPAATPDSPAEVPASPSMELPHEDAKPDSEHADEAAAGKPRNPC
jgi:hypothetical protein